jgi:hypothetical protein
MNWGQQTNLLCRRAPNPLCREEHTSIPFKYGLHVVTSICKILGKLADGENFFLADKSGKYNSVRWLKLLSTIVSHDASTYPIYDMRKIVLYPCDLIPNTQNPGAIIFRTLFGCQLERQMWWYTPIIPKRRRLKQEDHEFEASLGYIVRSCLKTTNKTKIKSNQIQEKQNKIKPNKTTGRHSTKYMTTTSQEYQGSQK